MILLLQVVLSARMYSLVKRSFLVTVSLRWHTANRVNSMLGSCPCGLNMLAAVGCDSTSNSSTLEFVLVMDPRTLFFVAVTRLCFGAWFDPCWSSAIYRLR